MRRAGFFVGVFLVATVMAVTSVAPSASAKSFEPDWQTVEPTYHELPGYQPEAQCTMEQWTVEVNLSYTYAEDQTKPMDVCVYHGKDFAFAWFTRTGWYKYLSQYSPTQTESGWAIAVGDAELGAKKLYPIIIGGSNVVPPWTVFGPESNAIYMATQYITYFGNDIYYEPDLTQKIHPVFGSDGYVRRYDYNADFANRRLNVDYLGGLAAFGVAHSNNGKWLVMTSYNEMVIYDTSSDKARIVERSMYYNTAAWPGQLVQLAISDDGKTVAFAGRNEPFRIIRTIDSCGRGLEKSIQDAAPLSSCAAVDLTAFAGTRSQTYSPYSGGARWYDFLSFNHESDSLTYYDQQKWATITAGNMQYTPKIKYLALGDSFASGEGDITIGASHYLPGTDNNGSYLSGIPREMCHMSDRSYPFLFAADMGLARGADMQSVACSGAVRHDLLSAGKAPDYLDARYIGQETQLPWADNGPRLRGISNATQLQDQARTDFTPGRVQQIEFVEKYHPQVATVMVSGNDLGFGDVISGCLMNIPSNKACSYVDADGRARMAASIRTNYEEQTRFYQALKAASPYTEYYAIGYPQFISDKGSLCWNSGGLTQAERTFIRESVSYVNQSIRNAAAAAGIRYINIENALDGVQMCDGKGVSGAIDRVASSLLTDFAHHGAILSDNTQPLYSRWLITQFHDVVEAAKVSGDVIQNPMGTIMGYFQQLFHPNSVGHQAIHGYVAAHYGGGSLLDAQCDGEVIICPESSNTGTPPTPDYFSRDNDVTINDRIVRIMPLVKTATEQVGDMAEGASNAVIRTNQDLTIVSPDAIVDGVRTIAIHSDSTILGKMQPGEKTAVVTLPPDFPIGFHTISLSGEATDGQPVEYAQYVFVEGPEGDMDGDGMPDKVDPCLFVNPSGVDTDGDGIDDACDLQVTAKTSEPNGPTSRGPVQGSTETIAIRGVGELLAPTVGKLAVATDDVSSEMTASASFSSPFAAGTDSTRVPDTNHAESTASTAKTALMAGTSRWLWVLLVVLFVLLFSGAIWRYLRTRRKAKD